MKCANKIPWSELNFKCLKETDKIVAKCLQYDKIFKNSAYDRLLGHRYVNKNKNLLIYLFNIF